MRIAIANGPGWLSGGVEIYLRGLISELLKRGHEVAVGFEVEISLREVYWPDGILAFNLSYAGPNGLDGYLAWGADIHYAHSLKMPSSWSSLLADSAPCVYFAHNYLSTCVSGRKCHLSPRVEPCRKSFGWPCLMHYFPRKCGGRNPLTMIRDFRLKYSLLQRIRECPLVLTHSRQMQAELEHHMDKEKIKTIPFCLPELSPLVRGTVDNKENGQDTILFLGRMEPEKGAEILLKSVELLYSKRPCKYTVIIAGDGRQKHSMERLGEEIVHRCPGVLIEFPGWLNEKEKALIFARSSVFAMPNLWPEPLGMAPLEALCHGLPVVGFDGGYAEFVIDGVTGRIVTGERSVHGFAQALEDCLVDFEIYQQAQFHAMDLRKKLSVVAHADSLISLLEGMRLP
ncbi:MAG: glycosyltransferase family 4 protein [Opitutae bacterium]|nr:glycosyltransferase family 4 protein [Opitutae bacterium]